jgi:TrmH family RNA methyltransferase
MDGHELKNLISIVLVNPKRSANIGSCARAMNCMGFKDMVLLAPRCQIDRYAFHLATGSGDILEEARIFKDPAEALKGYGLIIGTTRRKGKRRYNFLTPRQIVSEITLKYSTSRIAVLFGPEDYGLSREDLHRCQYLVEIPTDEAFGSLNLSQAVMTFCYELHCGLVTFSIEPDDEFPDSGELQKMNEVLEMTFDEIDFSGRKKSHELAGHFKEILARAALRKWEMRMVMGFLRHLRHMAGKCRPGAGGEHEGEE